MKITSRHAVAISSLRLALLLAALTLIDAAPALGASPAAPSNPGATAIQTDRITWTWSDNSSDEDGFEVWTDPGAATPVTLRDITAADVTSWTYTALNPNAQYSFQVDAANFDGASPLTNTFTAWTAIEPVTSLVFSAVTSRSLSVAAANSISNLSAGGSALYYRLQQSSSYLFSAHNANPVTFPNMKPNTFYTVLARSRNGAGVDTLEYGASIYTLAMAPAIGVNVVCDVATWRQQLAGSVFTFSNPIGFGAGTHGGALNNYKVTAFNYAWDTAPAHVFTTGEAQWSSGDLTLTCPAPGIYYLHLRSLNGDGVGSGAADYGPFYYDTPSPTLRASAPTTSTWVADRTVYAVASTTDTVYIGGNFHYVGPVTGNGVPFNLANGQPAAYPTVDGAVWASLPDGDGGWFIGGDFTAVGGVARNRLAHILPDGAVDPAWDPGADDTVHAIAQYGPILYVAGSFTTLGGLARPCLGALDIDTGVVISWNPNANGPVYALAASGGFVYAGGAFTAIGGQPRRCIAALDPATGAASAWNPDTAGSTGTYPTSTAVYALTISGGLAYVGGNFTTAGGQPRFCLAALDTVTTAATSWDPGADDIVQSLAVAAGVVYVGGSFEMIGGQDRFSLAAVDAATGAVTPWDPHPIADVSYVDSGMLPWGATATDQFINSIKFLNGIVYVAGYFNRIGGQWRANVAALDPATANALPWSPGASHFVYTLSAANGIMYQGGAFTSSGGVPRNCLAAINPATGAATAWNPRISYSLVETSAYSPVVSALAAAHGVVYAGGFFDRVAGLPRLNLAAIDGVSGAPTPWNPDVNNNVQALALSGPALYVGGAYSMAGGQARRNIAALDLVTTAALSWNPDANNYILALAAADGVVYAGGDFTTIGGQPRNRLAALDPATGLATAWNPNANGTVRSIQSAGSLIYAGGSFTTLGGLSRPYLAALSSATGVPNSWSPSLGGQVYALSVFDSVVYAGGAFTYAGGQVRNRLAAFNTSGVLLPWDPNADNDVWAMGPWGPSLYAGGAFAAIGGRPRPALASFDLVPNAPSDPAALDIQADRITWTWRDNSSDEEGFQIFSDPGSADPATLRFTTAPDATTWTQTGMSPNTQYTFQAGALHAGAVAKTEPYSACTQIETVSGVAFALGLTTATVAPANAISNLTAGSSGIYFANLTTIEDSGWLQSATPFLFSGLTPNARYTFELGTRNAIFYETAPTTASRYTLAPPPAIGVNIAANATAGSTRTLGSTFVFINPAGFGSSTHSGNTHKVNAYRYAWTANPTETFTGAEPSWSVGSLDFTPSAGGAWYLHLRPVNGDGVVSPPTYDWGPFIVQGPPVITDQPVSLEVVPGAPASFSVTATGALPLSYQWFLNGAPISGAIAPSYGIASVQLADLGTYLCQVTNSAGSDLSWPATLGFLSSGRLTPSTTTLSFTEDTPYFVNVELGGAPTTQSLRLVNTGAMPVAFTGGAPGTPGLALIGPNAADFQILDVSPSTALPLDPGTSVTLVIQFAPTETVRTMGLGAELVVTSDSTITPTLHVTLIADAVPVELSRFKAD